MSDKKSWGSTVMGWFVVQDQPQQAGKSDDYVPFSDDDAATIKNAAAAQPQLDVFTSPPPAAAPSPDADAPTIKTAAAAQPRLDVSTPPPPAAPGGDVDYEKVFEAAG